MTGILVGLFRKGVVLGPKVRMRGHLLNLSNVRPLAPLGGVVQRRDELHQGTQPPLC